MTSSWILDILKMMTVKELAKYINVKEKTIYNFVEKRLIPHYRLNRLIRFRKNEIDQWVDSKKVKS
jgi:excisionase family DNA binding protein